MPIPALIAAGASLIGGVLANKANAKQAREQMAFQQYMSDTAHRREVEDMRAAGLNPILSATGGPGASTPVGARAEMQDVVSPAVSSALAARRNEAEVENLEEQAERTRQEVAADMPHVQRANMQEDTLLKRENRDLATMQNIQTQIQSDLKKQELATERERTRTQAEETVRIRNEASAAGSSARLLQRDADIGTGKYGEVMKYLQILKDVTGGFGGGFRRGR